MLKDFFSAGKLVFTKPGYIFLAVIVAIIFFLAAVLFTGIPFLKSIFVYAPPQFLLRLKMFFSVWGYFVGNSTLWSKWLVSLVSILSGINLAMFVFYIKRKISTHRAIGTGFVGMVVSIFGIGCASCGSVVLSSIFGYTAVTGFLGILPFHGIEIGALGLALILVSIYLLSSKIVNPDSCKI